MRVLVTSASDQTDTNSSKLSKMDESLECVADVNAMKYMNYLGNKNGKYYREIN